MTKFNPTQFGRVVVLMGGMNAEREISLMSGEAVLAGLQRQGIDAVKLDVQADVIEQLQASQPNRAFIVLHGSFGEDGHIQAILESLQIPYTGSGVTACAVAMDKPKTQAIWNFYGIPTPQFILLEEDFDSADVVQTLGLPIAIKPADGGGSSQGVVKVTAADQLHSAYKEARKFDTRVMAEKWILGRELTVGIVADQVLPIAEIIPKEPFYDYKAKYFSDETQYPCPCELDSGLAKRIQSMAKKAYDVIGARHWGRVDLMLDNQDNPWFLEINPVPGMTNHSLVPKAAKVLGIDFDTLVVKILSQTLIETSL